MHRATKASGHAQARCNAAAEEQGGRQRTQGRDRAAETVETSRLRKEAMASIEDCAARAPHRARATWWGQIGTGAHCAWLHRGRRHRACGARAALRDRRRGVVGGAAVLGAAAAVARAVVLKQQCRTNLCATRARSGLPSPREAGRGWRASKMRASRASSESEGLPLTPPSRCSGDPSPLRGARVALQLAAPPYVPIAKRYRASGSGRSWNFTTFGRSLSPSMCQGARPA